MHLESTVLIHRKAEEVWRFLTGPFNLLKWDRGVAAVEVNEDTPPGVGFEFTTVGHPGAGPERGRRSYRVTAVDAEAMDSRAELTSQTGNARLVSSAEWYQHVEDAPEGSRVTMSAEFRLRSCHFWLAPLLYLFGKRAHDKDLAHLKNVLENA